MGLGIALLLCGTLVRMPAFMQLAPRVGPPTAPLLQPVRRSVGVATTAEASHGTTFIVSALLGAAAALASRNTLKQPRSGTLAGKGSELVMEEGLACAQIGISDGIDSLITMGQVPRRTHKRICDRGWRELKRQNRVNSAAKKRFLIRPDGSMWYIQPGLRHLKSKKSPARRKWLKRMFRVDRSMHRRLRQLLHVVPKPLRAEDFIIRKFNSQRLKDHLSTGDRVGQMMWTGPKHPRRNIKPQHIKRTGIPIPRKIPFWERGVYKEWIPKEG